MAHTHDTTCVSGIAVPGSQKWADFTDWVKSRVVTSKKDLRRRQIPLFEPAGASSIDGGDAHPLCGTPNMGGAASLLVNRCISQHESKKRVLGGVKFEVYPRSVRVVRPFQAPSGRRGGLRSAVDGFSDSSRRRLRRVASEAGEQLKSQFCLTYHETRPDGAQVKAHINAWLTWLRREVKGVKYLWVLEFQKRGVPHYHVFLSLEAQKSSTLHERMAYQWHKITGETSLQHLSFHWNAKNWISWDMGGGSYVCKYLEKENQKHVPDGFGWVGRFWGASRGLMPDPYTLSVYDFRALCLQDEYGMVSRETLTTQEGHTIEVIQGAAGRDVAARLIRTLGNFQKSRQRRYGISKRHLSQVKTSKWVQDGAAVFWKLVDYEMSQGGT